MSTKVALRTLDDLKRFNREAKHALDGFSHGGKLYVLSIAEAQSKRRVAQNSIMWLWWEAIGKQRGMAATEVHAEYKMQILPHIYATNDRYSEILELWLEVEQELQGQYELLVKVADKILSTAILLVGDFAKFLTESELITPDVMLPKPEDTYFQAVHGAKR